MLITYKPDVLMATLHNNISLRQSVALLCSWNEILAVCFLGMFGL